MKEGGWVTVTRDEEDEDGRIRFFKLKGPGVSALNRGREYYRNLSEFGEEASLAKRVAVRGEV